MSIKLSELVFNTVSDIHTSPIDSDMRTIVNAVEKVDGADIALRLQLEDKMRDYSKKRISEGEILNCLILANYVVQNSPCFRTQVAELSFVNRLQKIGKMKKLHEEANPVEDKVRELIAVWGTYFPCELSEYALLYKRYCAQSVINPRAQPTVFLPTEVTRLIPHVEHNLRNITRALEIGSGDLETIYKHGMKISAKYQKQCALCRKQAARYDTNQLNAIEEIGERLEEYLKELEKEIQNNSNKPVEPTTFSVDESELVRPTSCKFNVSLLPPPSSPKLRSILHYRGESPTSPISQSCCYSRNDNHLESSGDLSPFCNFSLSLDPSKSPLKGCTPNIFSFDEDLQFDQHQPGPLQNSLL
uniref:VHS domain-containing protein n=1 Tax=Entamoeba histolytica TaxID=5759 RepID=S0AZ97_ENTHI|nr:hypothetical protein [Entamoeba histolytica]BAN39566.1 hypothetical protein [Entamoeba histolytica]